MMLRRNRGMKFTRRSCFLALRFSNSHTGYYRCVAANERQRIFGRDIAMVAGANARAAACFHVSSTNAVLAACAGERLDLANVEEHQAGVPSDEATGSVVQDFL